MGRSKAHSLFIKRAFRKPKQYYIYGHLFKSVMKILLAEYSVCAGLKTLACEGRAMLETLRRSFESAGCTVLVPRDFEADLLDLSRQCDCFLVIAPDAILDKYTAGLEKGCINLGCSSRVVRLCADKRETTETLLHNGIPAPRLVHEKGQMRRKASLWLRFRRHIHIARARRPGGLLIHGVHRGRAPQRLARRGKNDAAAHAQ